jgi:hypothetical protein
MIDMAERRKLTNSEFNKLGKIKRPGRPRLYDDDMAEAAYSYCLLGATNDDLARLLKVSLSLIEKLLQDNPEFIRAVHDGRVGADSRVATALYQRACGYSHPAIKILTGTKRTEVKLPDGTLEKTAQTEILKVGYIEHYPPDTGAAMQWLANRQRAHWKMRQDNTIGNPDDTPLEIPQLVIVGIEPPPPEE